MNRINSKLPRRLTATLAWSLLAAVLATPSPALSQTYDGIYLPTTIPLGAEAKAAVDAYHARHIRKGRAEAMRKWGKVPATMERPGDRERDRRSSRRPGGAARSGHRQQAALRAKHRTPNFLVSATDETFARQVAHAAESYRRQLADLWLGRQLAAWSEPCPIAVHDGPNLGAGGATSFFFVEGQVLGWNMTIQGTRERILDSVLPHEVTHTIFATHFRRPLPRWADEGACTTVEHASERNKHRRMLVEFLRTGRGIAFHSMFAMSEYPPDVMPLYAQGHSLATYLIDRGGRQAFVRFLADGLAGDWPAAVRRHYRFNNLAALQNAWLDWVRAGSPIKSQQQLVLQPGGT